MSEVWGCSPCEQGNPEGAREAIKQRQQPQQQSDAQAQIQFSVGEHSKLDPPPRIETEQRHQKCHPKGNGQGVADVSRPKIKPWLPQEVLPTSGTIGVHFCNVLQPVGIGLDKQIPFATFWTAEPKETVHFFSERHEEEEGRRSLL